MMQQPVGVLHPSTQHYFSLFLEAVTASCEKVREVLLLCPKVHDFNNEFIMSSLSLCFVKVSFFPPCVVTPPGPGNICAGTVVKFLQPYLFIFPLVMISDVHLFVFVS